MNLLLSNCKKRVVDDILDLVNIKLGLICSEIDVQEIDSIHWEISLPCNSTSIKCIEDIMVQVKAYNSGISYKIVRKG